MKKPAKCIRYVVLVYVIFSLCIISVQANVTSESYGDALQIIIPVTAYAATLFLNDSDGSKQFHKSFLTNLGFTWALKISVDADRPENNGHHSFPSGHTSAAFQGASFVCKRYGWMYSIPLYFQAAYVGWSRVEYKMHYPRDVIAGATIGILSSYYFTTPYKGVVISPVAGNGFYFVRFAKKWG